MLHQVRLASPRHLSAQELAQVLSALKQQETDLPALEALCQRQREYFETGKTLPLDFRFQQLDALKRWIATHEEAIQEALFADLGKSAFEAYETEILTAREELHYLRTHLNTLAANAWYRAPLMHWAFPVLHRAGALWPGTDYVPVELSLPAVGGTAHGRHCRGKLRRAQALGLCPGYLPPAAGNGGRAV